MVLEQHRSRVDFLLLPMAQGAARLRITPDALTVFSLVLAFGAAVLLYLGQVREPWMLLAGGVLVLVSALLDALDGRLARLQGTASPRGDYLDHVTDRYADVAILLGIGLGPTVDLRITLFAVIGVLLTSYMGTQAQAVGVGRDYRGLLGRADRVVLLGLAPFIQGLLPVGFLAFGLSPFAWLLLFLGAFGNFTALQRFAAGWQELSRRPPGRA